MLNTDSLVDLIAGLGVEKRKILVSLPASVYRFTLVNGAENAPRSPTKSEQPVQISRSEMCEAMEQGEWIVERDEDLTAPYAFKDDTWIAFEDKISAGIKVRIILSSYGVSSKHLFSKRFIIDQFYVEGEICFTSRPCWFGNLQYRKRFKVEMWDISDGRSLSFLHG